MPHILIVDSNTAEANAPLIALKQATFGENYANELRACQQDLTITTVAPYEAETLPPLDGFDGVVFTGSSVEWNTDDARAKPIADVMRAVFAAGLPTLGSCNGMQLAASVLGGSSDASPNGREDGFAKAIELTEAGRAHPFLSGRDTGYAVPCVHRDEVTALPQGAVLLAGNAHSGVQAFAYEQDGVKFWGTQYHPELDPAFLGPRLAELGLLPPDTAADMEISEHDAQAAARLGIRPSDMQPDIRRTELRNWLASL